MGANEQSERLKNDIERSFQCQITGEAMNNEAQLEKCDKRNRLIILAVVGTFAAYFIWNIYNSRFEIQNHMWSIIILLVYIMFVMLSYILYRLYILERLMIKILRATKPQ